MKIVVLDDSKTYLSHIKKELRSLGFHTVYTFENEGDFFSFLKKHKVDIIFIDLHLKNTDGFEVIKKTQKLSPESYKIMITSDTSAKLQEEACKKGYDNFIYKNISKIEFKTLMNVIKTIRIFVKKEMLKNRKMEQKLHKIEHKEKIIRQKQYRIMKNDLEMFFDENYLIETFFKPKDILTGDTLFTQKFQNGYFLSIIDAMGKGLDASLTSFNAVSFLKHSINKAVEYNDFNFEKLVNDFVNYTKTIILENEILCATLIYIKDGVMHYANFGNPPLMTPSKTIPANNMPIRIPDEKIKIDSLKTDFPLFISSDGMFESPYKNSIYFKRLKELIPNTRFLKEITEDFFKNSQQLDDISAVLITKDEEMKPLFEKTIQLELEDINTFLETLLKAALPSGEKIHYIMHEILTNTYEHYILKHSHPSQTDRFYAKIKITKKDNIVKIDYLDNTGGFNVRDIKTAYHKKYRGRGIKIIKHLSKALFFNENGTGIKIFLKADNGH